jgi:hypothetical protein
MDLVLVGQQSGALVTFVPPVSIEDRPLLWTLFRSPLLIVNAHKKFHKRTNTIIAFTREYSRVSYLSTGNNG